MDKSLSELWNEIHSHVPGPDSEAWLLSVRKNLPSFGCGCNRHFEKILLEFPPDFSNFDAWRKVTWKWHNAVNVRLAKPRLSWEDACKVHGWAS